MTKLKNSIFQIISLTWCLLFWVVPALYFWTVLGSERMRADIGLGAFGAGFASIIFALLIGYVPMVFFGIGIVVITESVIRGGRSSVLLISSESWHAQIVSVREKTLCSYCWSVPFRMIDRALEVLSTFVVSTCSFVYLCLYVWFMSWSRDRNHSVSIFDVLRDNVKAKRLFHPRLAVVTPAPVKETSLPKAPSRSRSVFIRGLQLFTDLLSTVWGTAVMLKKKACPLIREI